LLFITRPARRQGKYLAPGGGPPQARLNRYRGRYAEAESRYGPRPNLAEATAAYAALAADAGLAPAELALRCAARRRPTVSPSGRAPGCQRAGGKQAGIRRFYSGQGLRCTDLQHIHAVPPSVRL